MPAAVVTEVSGAGGGGYGCPGAGGNGYGCSAGRWRWLWMLRWKVPVTNQPGGNSSGTEKGVGCEFWLKDDNPLSPGHSLSACAKNYQVLISKGPREQDHGLAMGLEMVGYPWY